LSFPDVTPLDSTKGFPRYNSILNRPIGDGVGIEEIDSLQMEIEGLLVNAMERNRKFQLELMILDNWKDKSDVLPKVLNKSLSTAATTSTGKNVIQNKKIKSLSGKPTTVTSKPSEADLLDLKQDNAPIVRNEIPDVFWQSVEPYVAEITDDDIKMLEEQIEMHDKILNQTKLLIRIIRYFKVDGTSNKVCKKIRTFGQALHAKLGRRGAQKRDA